MSRAIASAGGLCHFWVWGRSGRRGTKDAMLSFFQSTGLPGGRVRARGPVYFCRHGQTDWNAARRFQGHSDIPLNDIGRAQAARNGMALREAIGERDVAALARWRFYVSPLSRARETLEIIRSALGLSPRRYHVDDRLIEIDLGDWNGKTPDEIEAASPGAFEEREQNKWAFTVPNGESYADAASRTRSFLMNEIAGHQAPSVVVGHGASGRLLRGYLQGMARDEIPHLEARQDIILRIHQKREEAL